MPLQSVELLLDPVTDEAVRALWQALSDHGIPSQADHTGPTNAPHVTLAAVPVVAPAAEEALVALAARLPLRIELGAPVLLGERRPALVLAVRGEGGLDALHAAVAAVVPPVHTGPDTRPSPASGLGTEAGTSAHAVSLTSGHAVAGTSEYAVPGLPWFPHVTLARRLRPEVASVALGLLESLPIPASATATVLRRWDPDRREAWLVG